MNNPDPWKVVGDLCRSRECKHSWVGGTPHSIKPRTISPRGQRSREVYDVLDHNGELVETHDWECDAVDAAGSLALGVCSECGARRKGGSDA